MINVIKLLTYYTRRGKMKRAKLIVGLGIICLLCTTATFVFGRNPLENYHRRIPLDSGRSGFYSVQDVLEEEDKSIQPERRGLPVIIGGISVEIGQDIQLLSKTENEVVTETNDGERVVITQSATDKGIIIEYAGTTEITFTGDIDTITINGDGSVTILADNGAIIEVTDEGVTIKYQGTTVALDFNVVGEIIVDGSGVWICDKEGNRIGWIANEGRSFWKIKDKFVLFDKGVNLSIKGDSQGRMNYIEAETDAGKYILKLDGNQLTITSPSQDTLTIDTTKFHSLLLGRFSKGGEGWLSLYTQDYNQHIRVGFNSQGKIEKVALSTKHTEKLSPNSYRTNW